MTPTRHAKPSFIEAGLPCAALSAECQEDNNARQRPPQNRLHIWWARRPPTVCRVAILTGLLPFDVDLGTESTDTFDPPVTEQDLTTALSARERRDLPFYRQVLEEIPPTQLPLPHRRLLLALRIFGDPVRFEAQRAVIRDAGRSLPAVFSKYLSTNRDQSIPVDLIERLREIWQTEYGLATGETPVVLDSMAGGGVIPLEAVRYGLRVFANDLNPVAALTLKATVEYPTRFGSDLSGYLRRQVALIASRVRERLIRFFPFPEVTEWWQDVGAAARTRFLSASVVRVEGEAAREQQKNTYLWIRTAPCPRCELNVPLSTNFQLDIKGKPETHLAVFPVVPPTGKGNTCTFRIVRRPEWAGLRFPSPDARPFHPTETPTFKDGKAICPRCGHVMDGDEVKTIARARRDRAGLASQLYAVCSQVPVKLTYRNGETKVRYLWRFRTPTKADTDAVAAAEAEVAKRLPQWEAMDLIPNEPIEEGEKTREPRNMGICRWRDLFLPRQLLTNVTMLEEVRAAQERARQELPPDQAEAVAVYLSFMISKVVNYNSVNTSWDGTRRKARSSFMGHDYRYHPAYCEFEGARETVKWAASQVIHAYEELAGLVHGEHVVLSANDEEDDDQAIADDRPFGAYAPTEDEDQPGNSELISASSSRDEVRLRPEVIVPTVTCQDAAALSVPAPGTVHLICVDPPYYNNVQYSELSNFFYVWLKRALRDWPGLAHLFHEPLAESNREAVANAARWQREAEVEQTAWQARYDAAFHAARAARVRVAEARVRAGEAAGPKPLTAKERADRFYEDKMAAVFRRCRTLLHPRGRMVVMFNHKQTWAWRSLGLALTRAGFEIRSSAPIRTEAEAGLNMHGVDAARSTILLLCERREEVEQPIGNWASVQNQVRRMAEGAARRFSGQGIDGADLYLSALGPALGVVGRNWPVTDYAGREVDLVKALDASYEAVGLWRLRQIQDGLTARSDFAEVGDSFSAETVDHDTQILWLWLDTFRGELANTDDVRNLAKALNVDPASFQRMGLLDIEKEIFILRSPVEVDFNRLARRLGGDEPLRGRAEREIDLWEQRQFPNCLGAAVWNAIGLMAGAEDGPRGPEALRRWLVESSYGVQREFKGAYAVTLSLLESVFAHRGKADDVWAQTRRQARRGWDLVVKDWRGW